MRSFRTSAVVAAAAFALSWSGLCRAEDDVNSKKGTAPSIAPTLTQPYAETQQQASQTQTQTPRYSTTTISAASYDAQAARDRAEYEERKPNRSMLITGSAIFLGTYAASATVAAFSDAKADTNLFIPVVGPWLDIAERDCKLGECGTGENVAIAHIIGSGAAQAAGIAIAVGAFFVGERKDGRPAPQPKLRETRTAIQILPMSMRAGGGIGAFGTF